MADVEFPLTVDEVNKELERDACFQAWLAQFEDWDIGEEDVILMGQQGKYNELPA